MMKVVVNSKNQMLVVSNAHIIREAKNRNKGLTWVAFPEYSSGTFVVKMPFLEFQNWFLSQNNTTMQGVEFESVG